MSIYKPSGPALQNMDFRFLTSNAGALTSGVLLLSAIDLPDGFTVSNIYWMAGSTAQVLGTTPHYWVALYDASRNLRAASADNVAKAIAASVVITDAVATPYTVPLGSGGQYYIGIMVNSGGAGTQPTYAAYGSLSAITGTNSVGGGKFNGNADSGLGATPPNPAAAITQLGPIPWVGVS